MVATYIQRRILPKELQLSPVYIAPLNGIGILAYHILKQAGVLVQGFIDNDPSLQGERVCDTLILSPQQAIEAHKNATVIICSAKSRHAIKDQLEAIGVGSIIFSDSLLTSENVKASLSAAKNTVFPAAPERISLGEFDERFVMDEKLLEQPDAFLFENLVVCVTERCNLRCKDCSTLMQYYKHQEDIPLEEITHSFDMLFKTARYSKRINIQGGEPLLYHSLPDLVRHIGAKKVCRQLYVMTNGTIIPSHELLTAMQESDCGLDMNIYPGYEKKADEIERLCQEYQIDYRIKFDRDDWIDMRKFVDGRDWTESKLQQHFSDCQSYCVYLYRGHLYYCAFTAHARRLGAIPDDDLDSIDCTREIKIQLLIHFLVENKPVPSCRYCSGVNYSHGDRVMVAAQAKKTLPYPKFQ